MPEPTTSSLAGELAPTLSFSREVIACRLLDSSLTDSDRDFLRVSQIRKTARHFVFSNSERLRKLMARDLAPADRQ